MSPSSQYCPGEHCWHRPPPSLKNPAAHTLHAPVVRRGHAYVRSHVRRYPRVLQKQQAPKHGHDSLLQREHVPVLA